MTQTRRQRDVPPLRLLFDENLSRKVAKALAALGFRVTHVGAPNTPERGATDPQVVEFALKHNEIIVTSNHDMMILCHEEGLRFVWLDPRGKKLTAERQVLLVFSQVRDWHRLLVEGVDCVHAMKTRCEAMDAQEAARLARNRMRALERRKSKRRATTVQAERLTEID